MDLPKEIDEKKIEDNRVLEYYRKYSQNPQLTKYFTGPEASFVEKKLRGPEQELVVSKEQTYKTKFLNEEIQGTEEPCLSQKSVPSPSSPGANQTFDQDEIEDKIDSRSSSVASNKVEWDNGADIGYKNSYLFSYNKKSASFPSLLSKNSPANVQVTSKETHEKSFLENVEELRKKYHQLTFSSDSSTNKDSSSGSKEQIASSSSSQEIKMVQKSSSSSSDSYLKKRIGFPVAYSTPHEDTKESSSKSSTESTAENSEASKSRSLKQSKVSPKNVGYSVTPMLTLPVKPKRNLNNDELSETCLDSPNGNRNNIQQEIAKNTNYFQKRVDLCLTKPIFVECIERKESAHKDVQTSFLSNKSSKSVQTEEIEFGNKFFDPNIERLRNLKHFKEAGSDLRISEDFDLPNCKSIQTENIFDDKKSSEGAKSSLKNDVDKLKKLPKKPEKGSSDSFPSNAETTSTNINSTDNSVESGKIESQLEEMLLAEMISLNYSKNLKTDMGRSIKILLKLLESKRYDKATKKFYVRKIIQKIVNSKYSDDSTSSDFSAPKNSNPQRNPDKIPKAKNESCKNPNLMDNLPWYPATKSTRNLPSENKEEINTDRRNLKGDNQIYSESIKEKLKIPHVHEQTTKNYLRGAGSSTVDDSGKQNFRQEKRKYQKNPSFSSSELNRNQVEGTRNISSEGRIGSRDWRTAQTMSEKLLEKRDLVDFKKGQGDYLLHVVKNERHHQLSWINTEIDYLLELKKLLEKPKSVGCDLKLGDAVGSLRKDVSGIKKNFDIFICNGIVTKGSIKKDEGKSRKKTACLTPGYYTIETQLDPDGNLMDLTVFDGNGNKKYNYRTDGVVDDVSISSKNRNTAVKLKPKVDGLPGRPGFDMCTECFERRFFSSSQDSEESLCEKCIEVASATSKGPRRKCKVCRACRNLFTSPEKKPKVCICEDHFGERTALESKLSPEKCEACGALLLERNKDSSLCLCKKCKRKLLSGDGKSYGHKQRYNFCEYCGKKFEGDSEESMCEECFDLALQRGVKCACEETCDKNACRCVPRFPRNIEVTKEEKSSPGEICKVCGVELNRCTCGPKFLPKTPKLIGVNAGNLQATKGNVYNAQTEDGEKGASIYVQTDESEKKSYYDEVSTTKNSNIPDIDSSKYETQSRFRNSSSESPKFSDRNTTNGFSIPQRKESSSNHKPTRSTRNFPFSSFPKWLESGSKQEKVNALKSKKSCQCCTCVNCGVQTKRPGDKNVRCQCCICENCSTQVSLDERVKNRKSIKSRWCRNSPDTKTNKQTTTIASNQNRYSDLDKKKKSKRDMSRSCESLDYPCKPLKPRVSDIEERPSVESLTCPSKRSVCPAKPPPCPGVGDRPCPSYPPKPCPSRKNAKFEEDHNSKRYGNERRSSHENDSVLFPVSIKSQSPLQDVRGRTNSSSESSSQDFRTHDDKPLMTSNLPSGIVREKIQMQISRNRADIPKQNDCNCKVECCKCSQTATHEEKDIQCPAFKQCTCQTEPKEDACVQCICKENVEPLGKNTNEDKGYLCQCETSSSSSTSRSNSSTSCICCKKQKILKNLADKIPLCEPCQEVNKSNFYPHDYSNPIHSCLCYNLVDRNLLYQFKDTLNELQRLEIYQQYCEVLKNCKCCKKCGCKYDCPNSVCEEDNSNGEEEDRKNRLPEVTVKIPNCRGCCGRHRRDENWSKTNHYTTHSSIQNYLFTMKPEFVARAERRRKILRNATVQREENSEKRKLNFIEKIAYLNEENEQKSSVLKPYNSQTYCVFDIGLNNLPKKVQPKVFKSFKEMKELTRRKYLTLNEVKSKKNVYREKRLREANRLLANTFTRRLQRSTLRGTVDIPLNVRVVTF